MERQGTGTLLIKPMRVVVLISLLLHCLPICAQRGYADFVVSDSTGWLLTQAGGLEQVDIHTMQSTVLPLPPAPRLTAIAKDTANNLVVADSAGQLWRLNKQTRLWSVVATCPYASPYALIVDQHNQYLIVHPRGIWTADTHGNHFPDDSLLLNKGVRGGMRTTRSWEEKPVWLLDSEGRLWLGFDYGEWGGLLFIFDTRRQQFVQPQPGDFDLAFNPIVSITQAGRDLYLAGSMRHMHTDSHIARVTKLSATTVFTSESCWDHVVGRESALVYGQSVSLLAFNPVDNQLYAYIDGAIVKTSVTNQSATIDRWTQVIPRSSTDNDRVIRMAFTPTGQLALLYKNRGLGLVDGKAIRFVKPSVTSIKNG